MQTRYFGELKFVVEARFAVKAIFVVVEKFPEETSVWKYGEEGILAGEGAFVEAERLAEEVRFVKKVSVVNVVLHCLPFCIVVVIPLVLTDNRFICSLLTLYNIG